MAAISPKVHVHTSSPDAFFVNSFLLEGESSLILVDTQFVLSEARAVIDRIAALAKPLAAIFITHPHPDHFNGLACILERYPGVPVHATAATIDGIRATAEPKRAYWTPIVGPDYPQTFATPGAPVRDGEHLSIDGIECIIHDFGPTECSDNTAIELPQIEAVIVSDLVYNRVHPWLAEGRSELWLAALDRAKRRFASARVLYAGHGAAGPASILDEQAAYIRAVRNMVAQALKKDPALSDAGKAAVRQSVLAAFSNWPLESIVDMNTASLASEALSQGWASSASAPDASAP
jgi:glyoxylase-like metal-dependent hydrolase (beta-lactamase superfamily II)